MNMLDQSYWFEVVRNLFFITAVAVGTSLLTVRWIRSAYWQRTVWQIAFVSIALLSASEVTGLTKGFALWFGGKKPVPQRFSVRTFDPAPANPALSPQEEVTPVDPAEPAVTSSPMQKETSMVWPGLIWTCGTTVILARILFSQAILFGFRFRRQSIEETSVSSANRLAARLGLKRHISVRQSPALRSPIAFGIFRKTIVLPEGFSELFNLAQREAVLAHELAHLASNDPAWYLVADCVTAVFWWNPLIWLARQKLHAASETAADEASLLVQDGATTLAECLIHLAKQFASTGAFGWMSIEGNGFRSNLARRVERLLTLQQTEWHTPRRPAVLALKVFAPILLVTLAIVSSAWAQRDRTQPNNLNSALHQTWNDSVGALALNAVTTSADTAAADQPPAATPSTPVKPKISPSVAEKKTPLNPLSATNNAVVTSHGADANAAAAAQAYYGRTNVTYSPQEAAANAAEAAAQNFARTNTTSMSAGRKKIWAKLNSIRVPHFSFAGRPLGDVLKSLTDESVQRDSAREGINFMVNSKELDIKMPLPNVSLSSNLPIADILSTMAKVALISYHIEDYAVVITTNKGPAEQLYSKTFRVNAIDLTEALNKRGLVEKNKIKVNLQPNGLPQVRSNETAVINGALRDYFATRGVNLEPPKYLFFNDRFGQILVRATQADLEKVAVTIEKLVPTPPQLTIEVKIVEISETDAKALGFDWFLSNSVGSPQPAVTSKTPATPATVSVGTATVTNVLGAATAGIFTDPQYRVVLRALEQRGAKIFTLPRVTTLGGRQAYLSSEEATTVVSGANFVTNANGKVDINFATEDLFFGPVVDVIPDISEDGFACRLTLMLTLKQFLGYDDVGSTVHPSGLSAQTPAPKFLAAQMAAQATVWDRETIMLSGVSEAELLKKLETKTVADSFAAYKKNAGDKSDKEKKHLVMFVTPTIIDPAGNRVHDDVGAGTQATPVPASVRFFPDRSLDLDALNKSHRHAIVPANTKTNAKK